MGRISDSSRARNQDAIRAAMDRLLRVLQLMPSRPGCPYGQQSCMRTSRSRRREL